MIIGENIFQKSYIDFNNERNFLLQIEATLSLTSLFLSFIFLFSQTHFLSHLFLYFYVDAKNHQWWVPLCRPPRQRATTLLFLLLWTPIGPTKNTPLIGGSSHTLLRPIRLPFPSTLNNPNTPKNQLLLPSSSWSTAELVGGLPDAWPPSTILTKWCKLCIY